MYQGPTARLANVYPFSTIMIHALCSAVWFQQGHSQSKITHPHIISNSLLEALHRVPYFQMPATWYKTVYQKQLALFVAHSEQDLINKVLRTMPICRAKQLATLILFQKVIMSFLASFSRKDNSYHRLLESLWAQFGDCVIKYHSKKCFWNQHCSSYN